MIQAISIDNSGNLFYSADELKKEHPEYFYGTSATVRDIIKRKNIPMTEFLYASHSLKNGWTIGSDSSKKTKLFLKKSWVEENIYKIRNVQTVEVVEDEEDVTERAPEILELEESEKFRDIDGNIIEIETRGEKHPEKIFFRVKDISEKFGLPNLTERLVCKETKFEKSIHYCNFFIQEKLQKKESGYIKKVLFLTYFGLTRLLFVSHNKNAEFFQKWAIKNLFTIQMGVQEQKDELASELIGVNAQTIKSVFRTNTEKTPVVYLFVVGNAKKILGGSYTNDDLICKYGYSDDLPRRTDEHQKNFKKEFGFDVELYCYSIIDPVFISKAESNVRSFMDPFKIEYKNQSELVVLNKKNLNQVKEMFGLVQKSYIGRYVAMGDEIKRLEKEMLEMKYGYEMQIQEIKHTVELKDRDISLKEQEIKLRDKDIEILELKLMVAKMENRK